MNEKFTFYNFSMFIVFDAIDGAGKGRQREEIMHILSTKYNLKIEGEEFPVHNSFYETVIHPALQEETTMNPSSWVLSYLLDKTLAAPRIEDYLGSKDKHFISDGYFTTTIAYQCFLMKQVPLNKLLQYAEDFTIPTPDLCIYIDADPEIALSRKNKEEGHTEGLDIFEKSLGKQKELRKIFRKMVTEQIYAPWEMVDGNGTIEEVTENILEILRRKKLIS
jgi:thymidylate kinase